MPHGTPYIPDTVAVSSGATIANLTASQMTSKFGAGNIKTPTKNFSIQHRGHTLSFRQGVPIVMDAALQATFTAHNAPVV